VTAVGPYCRGGPTSTAGWVGERGTAEEFERGKVGAMGGQVLGGGGERKTNWPGLHLRGFQSIRRGRVCVAEEKQRRVSLAVGLVFV